LIQLSAVECGKRIFEKKIFETTTIVELERSGKLFWSDAIILGETLSFDGMVTAVCGEGDHGSDGFVAVLSAESRKLLWLAAFDCSNPFDSVEFIGAAVYAQSTLGKVWRFPLAEPCNFTVE
jgi:hypothetical protein